MPSTANSSKNSSLRGGSDRALYIAHICATRDKAWCLSYHAIPDGARVFEPALTGAQQLTFELLAERRVDLFTGFVHFALSLQDVLVTHRGRRSPKRSRGAGYARTRVRSVPKKQKTLEPTIAIRPRRKLSLRSQEARGYRRR